MRSLTDSGPWEGGFHNILATEKPRERKTEWEKDSDEIQLLVPCLLLQIIKAHTPVSVEEKCYGTGTFMTHWGPFSQDKILRGLKEKYGAVPGFFAITFPQPQASASF